MSDNAHFPHPQSASISRRVLDGEHLGPPLGISEVAQLLGCSEWTVRQRYMRLGLPYLRTSAAGKLVFFRAQVIAWILERQQRQKGGIR